MLFLCTIKNPLPYYPKNVVTPSSFQNELRNYSSKQKSLWSLSISVLFWSGQINKLGSVSRLKRKWWTIEATPICQTNCLSPLIPPTCHWPGPSIGTPWSCSTCTLRARCHLLTLKTCHCCLFPVTLWSWKIMGNPAPSPSQCLIQITEGVKTSTGQPLSRKGMSGKGSGWNVSMKAMPSSDIICQRSTWRNDSAKWKPSEPQSSTLITCSPFCTLMRLRPRVAPGKSPPWWQPPAATLTPFSESFDSVFLNRNK